MSKEWSYGENNKNIVLSEIPKQRLRITGHRISSILGLNQYQSEFGAWAEITRLVKLPFEDSKYTIFGNAVEPKLIDMVREEFPNVMSIAEYYGINIERYRYNNFVEDSDVFGGVIDAVATENDMKTLTMIVECKSSSKPHLWENGNVPVDYLLQGCLYSYLKGLDRVLFICCFPQDLDYNHPENFKPDKTNTIMVLKKLKNVLIEMPNGEMKTFEEVIEYCKEWWNKYIETGISPEFDETKDKQYLDIIRTSKPLNDKSIEELCNKAKKLTDEINDLMVKNGITEKEKELKKLKENIKQGLMNNLQPGETKISCKQYLLNGTIKDVFDETKFKNDHLNMYNKYLISKTDYRLNEIKEEDKENE